MMKQEGAAELTIPGAGPIRLDMVEGSMGDRGVVTSPLLNYKHDGRPIKLLSVDPATLSTATTVSGITYIDPTGDGKQAVLLYRGYPVAQCAQIDALEIAHLLYKGELPTQQELDKFKSLYATEAMNVPTYLRRVLKEMPRDAHPMAMLGTMMNAFSATFPQGEQVTLERFDEHAMRILFAMPQLCADVHAHKINKNQRTDPDPSVGYAGDYLRMMFSTPVGEQLPDPVSREVMNAILIAHADHEQNASTTVARNITSTGVNPYAAISGAIGALWGPKHGGANQDVMAMLDSIQSGENTIDNLLAKATTEDKAARILVPGLGHRVYKAMDPRALVMAELSDRYFADKHIDDPRLQIAREIETRVRGVSYFEQKQIWPNVDFYSGILMSAMGIPMDEFTVVFALGRTAGWLAQAREVIANKEAIARPRQIYDGPTQRDIVPIEQRV